MRKMVRMEIVISAYPSSTRAGNEFRTTRIEDVEAARTFCWRGVNVWEVLRSYDSSKIDKAIFLLTCCQLHTCETIYWGTVTIILACKLDREGLP
jgi:hypothetical protein